eukprot:697191-Rhodomonas_salina.1
MVCLCVMRCVADEDVTGEGADQRRPAAAAASVSLEEPDASDDQRGVLGEKSGGCKRGQRAVRRGTRGERSEEAEE